MGGRRRGGWAVAAAAVLGAMLVLTGVHLIVRDTVRAETFGPAATPAVDAGHARAPAGSPHRPEGGSPSGGDTSPAASPSRGAPERPGGDVTSPADPHTPLPPSAVSFTDVHAEVVPVSTLASGALQLPADPAVVGWWAAGAVPGAPEGTVVLAGHMDGRHQSGAMRALLEVTEGDVVEVTDHVGGSRRYGVTARTATPRTELDPALFTRTGPHRLVLITCGGRFDERSGRYEDNIVVVAEPLP